MEVREGEWGCVKCAVLCAVCCVLCATQCMCDGVLFLTGHRVYGTELKGLDIVRRDWCELAKKAGQ